MLTIGHSNHDITNFIQLLKAHGVEAIADVRSHPYSKYAPQYNMPILTTALAEVGIRYVFMGDQLGGRPREMQFYDEQGYVRYDRIATSRPFRSGIVRVERAMASYTVALMCSEENPAHCHRHLLIGHVLEEVGIDVVHIRGDGTCQSGLGLTNADIKCECQEVQLSLFNVEEDARWRSIRSVFRDAVRKPSSSN